MGREYLPTIMVQLRCSYVDALMIYIFYTRYHVLCMIPELMPNCAETYHVFLKSTVVSRIYTPTSRISPPTFSVEVLAQVFLSRK